MATAIHARGLPSRAHALLLRAALLDGARAREAFTRWRHGIDPMALDETSFRLLPLLAKNLIALRIDDPQLERWKGTYRRAVAYNAMLAADLSAVAVALASAKIELLALGVPDVDWLWPLDGTRILVASERAEHVLRSAGYAGRGSSTAWSFIGPSGRNVIVRRYLLDENCAAGADDPVWRSARAGRLEKRPSAAFELLHACVAGLRGGAWWAAAAFVLSASGEVDWEELVTATSARRLALPMRTSLHWIREHLDAPVPGQILARLDALPVGVRDHIAPIVAWGLRAVRQRLSR